MNRLTLLHIILLFLGLLLGGLISCTSEEPGIVPINNEEEVNIPFPFTKGQANTGNPEDSVATARLIVLRNGKVLKNILKDFSEINGESHIVFEKIPMNTGYADFFMITNEASAGWNLSVSTYAEGAVLSASALKSIVKNYNAYPQVRDGLPPIPMVGIHEKMYVHSDSLTYKDWGKPSQEVVNTGEVERMYAKVSIDIDCVFADMPNLGDPVTIDSICIKTLPKKAYLAPISYWESDFFDGTTHPLTSEYYTRTTDRFDGSFSFYIPEYIITDTAQYAYIFVKLKLVNSPDVTRDYRVVIGNGIGTDRNAYLLGNNKTIADLIINRNKHYNFVVHIKGFDGSSGSDLDIIGKIVDWNASSTDPEEPYEYDLSVPNGDFKIGSGAYEGVATITTDHKNGWRATLGGSYGTDCTITEPSNAGTVNQYGTKLKFRIAAGATQPSDGWIINVKAGKINKQIKVTRN